MGSLILRSLLQHGSLASARAVAVTALRELPSALTNQGGQTATQSLCGVIHPASRFPSQSRALHATPAWDATVEVKVPPLGESITDGTVSTLLKQPGEAVAEDEPVLQIETDKVTIDVRAPTAGTLGQFLVKGDDTVVVGQPIVTILTGAEAEASQPEAQQAAAAQLPPPPKAAAAAPPPPPPPPKQQQQPAAPSFAAAAAAAPAPKRKPSIKFPPRRTETGEVLSLMPAAQRQAYLQAAAKAAEAAAKPRPTIAPLFQKSGPPMPRPPRQLVRPAPQIPRIMLSDADMERIMLGGADP